MLFDPHPKVRREDLYDREHELREVLEAVRLGERLVVVYGVRRVGKTSLVNVALEELGQPYVVLDGRAIYFREGVASERVITRWLVEGLRRGLSWYRRVGFSLVDALRRVRGVRVAGVEVEVEPSARLSLPEILSSIDEWCGGHGLRFIVVLDEAQYLKLAGSRLDPLIAWAVDRLSSTTFIVTGSMVGLLEDFLRLGDPRAPLYGRYRREVYLDRFTREQAMGFLEEGFREHGVRPRGEELEEVCERLDGIVGWLTHYGYYRCARGMRHNEALRAVFEEGSALLVDELEKLIAPSRSRYLAILKAVALGARRWRDIKAYVEAATGRGIDDKRFTRLLTRLVKYGYLAKDDKGYKIPDPVTAHLVLEKLHS